MRTLAHFVLMSVYLGGFCWMMGCNPGATQNSAELMEDERTDSTSILSIVEPLEVNEVAIETRERMIHRTDSELQVSSMPALFNYIPKRLNVSVVHWVEQGPHLGLSFQWESIDYRVFLIDLKKGELQMYYQDSSGSKIITLNKLIQTQGPFYFATNGGIFTPQFEPEGLYIEQGKQIKALNRTGGAGNFYLKPNGVFYITPNGRAVISETEKFAEKSYSDSQLQYALQSGPLLLINGKIHPEFREGSTNTFIRSGVGIIDANTVAFVISQQPVNFHSFATVFKDYLGCSDALYLDGAISQAYIPGLNMEFTEGNFAVLVGIPKKTMP